MNKTFYYYYTKYDIESRFMPFPSNKTFDSFEEAFAYAVEEMDIKPQAVVVVPVYTAVEQSESREF